MTSATNEPPGGLSGGVPTEVRMASALVKSPGWGALRPLRQYVRYTPLALGLSAFWGWPPCVFCFLFSFPSLLLGSSGPCT